MKIRNIDFSFVPITTPLGTSLGGRYTGDKTVQEGEREYGPHTIVIYLVNLLKRGKRILGRGSSLEEIVQELVCVNIVHEVLHHSMFDEKYLIPGWGLVLLQYEHEERAIKLAMQGFYPDEFLPMDDRDMMAHVIAKREQEAILNSGKD